MYHNIIFEGFAVETNEHKTRNPMCTHPAMKLLAGTRSYSQVWTNFDFVVDDPFKFRCSPWKRVMLEERALQRGRLDQCSHHPRARGQGLNTNPGGDEQGKKHPAGLAPQIGAPPPHTLRSTLQKLQGLGGVRKRSSEYAWQGWWGSETRAERNTRPTWKQAGYQSAFQSQSV